MAWYSTFHSTTQRRNSHEQRYYSQVIESPLRTIVVLIGNLAFKRLLPPRGTSKRVNHALTVFDHLVLPSTALLGTVEKDTHPHHAFKTSIWRVAVGSLALGSIAIPALEISTSIASRYSIRRHVTGPNGSEIPIFTFRTQQMPILIAIADAFVLRALWKNAIKWFVDDRLDFRARHGIAACVKAVMVQHSQEAHWTLSERCGAQGLFKCNQFVTQYVRDSIVSLDIELTECFRVR